MLWLVGYFYLVGMVPVALSTPRSASGITRGIVALGWPIVFGAILFVATIDMFCGGKISERFDAYVRDGA